MAGFIRRFGSFPGVETITLIEGVSIVDLPPPGTIQGVGEGTVAVVGEFADMTYATSVTPSTGGVATLARPVEAFSSQDMLDKVGGWDSTIGKLGGAGGNGFVSVRSKKFSRLVLVPVNLASPLGVRVWRDLPTNLSSTNPIPFVPLQAGTVPAGYEFKTGTSRARLAAKVSFSDAAAYLTGTDGAVTAAGSPAATQTFTSAGGAFTTNGTAVGDLLVLGVVGGAGALGANAATYRVTTVTSATALVVQKLDGTSFDWTTGTSQPWRLHVAAVGDSGGQTALSSAAGAVVPARPLDATIAQATNVSPTVAPAAQTSTSWDPLSGLTMRTSPTSPGLAFDTNVQAPNASNHASIDALYTSAIDALLGEDQPARDVNIVFSSRTSSTIRAKLKAHVLTASSSGVGRLAVLAPDVSVTQTTAASIADSDPGAGGSRDERVAYSWPGVRIFVPEAVNTSIATADAKTTTDGVLDLAADGWLAAVMSNLAPERNPGQASPPVPEVLAPIAGIQRGVSNLAMADYIQLRQKGVAGIRIDRTVGPIFQSGITTSLTAGQKNINRRRMADFIEDSVAQRLVQFTKLPLTNQLRDAATGEIVAFMDELLSPNNPAAQRISDYEVDPVSGNTPTLESQGIFVIIVRVRTLATADFIVLQAEIGEGVVISTT